MGDESMSDGVEHLQRAARELIAAARSFLDVAEELVEDGDIVGEASVVLRRLARDVTGVVRRDGPDADPFGEAGSNGNGTRRRDEREDAAGDGAEGSDGPAADRTEGSATRSSRSRVRRIDVE